MSKKELNTILCLISWEQKKVCQLIVGVGVWVKVFRFCSWVLYFKDYITTTQNCGQKVTFHYFWWLAPQNSKNLFFLQKSVKNQDPDGYHEIEAKVKCWFGVSVWLYKQNYKRISRNTFLKWNVLPTSQSAKINKKSNDMLPNYRFSFFKKKSLQVFPLDGSATFLSFVVQEVWNFVRKDQLHLISVITCPIFQSFWGNLPDFLSSR